MTGTSFSHRVQLILITAGLFSVAGLTAETINAAPPAKGDTSRLSAPAASSDQAFPRQPREAGPRRRPHRHDPRLYQRSPNEQQIVPRGRILKLILMIRFRDHLDRKLPSREDYELIFNREGGHSEFAPEGSAADYSRQISYDQMEIKSHIVGWIDLPEKESYYANGDQGTGPRSRMYEAIRYALDYVDRNQLVDFREFDREDNNDGYADLVGFVHSGFGAEWGGQDADGVYANDRIWSHQWKLPSIWKSRNSNIRVVKYACSSGLYGRVGSEPCRIGLLAHEAAHLGELPDLYGGEGSGNGIGAWGLMGFSDGFLETGHRPTHMSAWSKLKLGWVKPQELTSSGVYQIEQAETKSERFPQVYIIKEGFPDGEYLLIENRQPVGFDREIPNAKGGLAIWHIDENKWNKPGTPHDEARTENLEPGFPGQPGWPSNNRHYMVALVQADGRFDLEQGQNYGDDSDLFRGGGGVDEIDSIEPGGLRPYIINEDEPQPYRRISQISAPGKIMSFRYEVRKNSNAPVPPIARKSDPPPAKELTSQTTPEVRPITGAKIASASFTHLDRVQLIGDGVLLRATVTLKDECTVYIRANTSLKAVGDCGVVTTGFNDGRQSETAMWKESVRIVTTRPDREYASVDVSTRRRLPPGTHTIRWVIRSNGTLQFHSGGVLAVQAYPCPPSNAASGSVTSSSKGLASASDR